MPEVVTRLVVAADGSLRTLDQFEQGMEQAGRATDYTTGAVTDFQRRMDAARAAMERGNAITTQTVQRKSAEQRAWETWSATVDRTTALRIRLEREAANAAVAATNAVVSGFATQEQALTTLSALEQRHNAQIAASIAMHNREASAIDNSTASMRMNTAAANDNAAARRASGAHAGHTTNLLFQAQDIAMMTAMGQAPLMLALQQGTQVGGIFHQIGNGRQIVTALGGALAGLLNPLNLATIAFIGLGAAGVQALMSIGKDAEDATSALEEHSKWLDAILIGYDAAREAAAGVVEQALKLPQASAESNLQAEYSRAMQAEMSAIGALVAKQDELIARREVLALGQGLFETIIRETDALAGMAFGFEMTKSDLDQFHSSITELLNSEIDAETRVWAEGLLDYINQAREARSVTESLATALRLVPREVRIRLSMQQEFGSAMSEIEGLYVDPRSQFDIAREQLDFQAQRAEKTATSYSQLVGLAEQYDRVLKSINAAEAEANKPRRTGGGDRGASGSEQWGTATDSFQQRIDQMLLETELVGQSTYEIERQKAAFDLLNQAKAAGIEITPALNEQIAAMAGSYADASVALQSVTQLLQPEAMPWDIVADQMRGLDVALQNGAISWEQYGAAAQRAHMLAASSTLGAVGQITSTLAGAFENNKAFAVANAVINTAEGVTKALAQGGMFAFPMAAAVAAAGAAQIGSILSAKPGSSSRPSVGGAGGGAAAPTAAPAEQSRVIHLTLGGNGRYSRDEVRDLIEQLTEELNDGAGTKFKMAVNG